MEVATAPLERNVSRTASKSVQNLQMGGYCVDRGLQVCWKCKWFCRICTTIDMMATICSGSLGVASFCENGESHRPRLVERGVDWWLLMATNGVDVWRKHGADMASLSGVACGRLLARPFLGTECCVSFQRNRQNVLRDLSVVQEECCRFFL